MRVYLVGYDHDVEDLEEKIRAKYGTAVELTKRGPIPSGTHSSAAVKIHAAQEDEEEEEG